MQGHNNDDSWVWKYYQAGRNYNNRLVPNQYNLVNTNWAFYTGNQWENLPQTKAMQRLSKPTFNIIKRVAQVLIASLTSSATTINYEPLSYYDGTNIADPSSNAADFCTDEVRNLFEKFKMEYRIRELLTEGAVTGDYCMHFWWDPDARPYGGAFGPYRGEIRCETLDGLNVMFGNPNSRDVQSQPYVLLVGRDTAKNLNAEAERCRKLKKGKTDGLVRDPVIFDTQTWDQAGIGGQIEIEPDDDTGKAIYALLYTKVTHEETAKDPKTGAPIMENVLDKDNKPIPEKDKDGNVLLDPSGLPIYKKREMKEMVTTVYATKATKSGVIFEDWDTGLSLYPVAWGNWEKQKNQYHGRALVTGVVPNQIFLNTMFATVMRHMQLLGFPKTVYNADYIREWNNEVGQAIGIHGLAPGQAVNTVAFNLQPADMSNQIITTIDKTLQYTKECLGVTDAQMGNVKPDNTSALMVLQSNSEVPLENIRAGLYEFIEDVGAILPDMMGTYYGERPIVRERIFKEIVTDPNTGAPVIDPATGKMKEQEIRRKAVETFDFSQFKNLWFNEAVNIGATTYYSEIAMVQTLDNLHRDGTLDTIDYLERLPEKLLPRKDELIRKLRELMGVQPTEEELAAQGGAPKDGASNPLSAANVPTPTKPNPMKSGAAPSMGGPISEQNAVASLPQGVQGNYPNMPPTAQNSLKRMAGMRSL